MKEELILMEELIMYLYRVTVNSDGSWLDESGLSESVHKAWLDAGMPNGARVYRRTNTENSVFYFSESLYSIVSNILSRYKASAARCQEPADKHNIKIVAEESFKTP